MFYRAYWCILIEICWTKFKILQKATFPRLELKKKVINKLLNKPTKCLVQRYIAPSILEILFKNTQSNCSNEYEVNIWLKTRTLRSASDEAQKAWSEAAVESSKSRLNRQYRIYVWTLIMPSCDSSGINTQKVTERPTSHGTSLWMPKP